MLVYLIELISKKKRNYDSLINGPNILIKKNFTILNLNSFCHYQVPYYYYFIINL